MTLKLNAAQKRGLWALSILLLLLLVWRGRVLMAPAAAPPTPAQQSEAPLPKLELNTADSTQLITIQGIGPTFARRIIRYRTAIGGFHTIDQLQKLYGMTPENFSRIAPQLYIDTTTITYKTLRQRKSKPFTQFTKTTPTSPFPATTQDTTPVIRPTYSERPISTPKIANINTADSTTLVHIPGIGPSTASRIIKYRERLLFFRSLTQLSEVYGIRPENLDKMLPHLTIGEDFSAFPKIYINTWDTDHLGRHPYIGYKDARIITAYRTQHGPFQSIQDLHFIQGIDPNLPFRLEGYLQF